MSSQQNQAISVARCREWRDRYERGWSIGQIVDHYGRGQTTVNRHVHDRCSHVVEGGEWGGSDETDCPLCGESIVRQNLALHLPECPGNDPASVAGNGGESA